MGRIFDEKLEGVGYEEAGAIENVGAGCTIDEDADSADVGSPSGWGSQCLKIITLADTANRVEWYNFGPEAISYFRFEVVITAENLGLSTKNQFAQLSNDAWDWVFALYIYKDAGGNLRLRIKSFHDGSGHYYVGFPIVSLNTRYRIEVKWDATNDHWAWKIDGVNQPNDQDASDPVTTEGNLTDTHPVTTNELSVGSIWQGATDFTTYHDLIAIDDMDWIGAEGGISIPVVMQNMRGGFNPIGMRGGFINAH